MSYNFYFIFIVSTFSLFENVYYLLKGERRENKASCSQIHNFISFNNNNENVSLVIFIFFLYTFIHFNYLILCVLCYA